MKSSPLPAIFRWWVPWGLAVVIVMIYSRIPGFHEMSLLDMTALLAVWAVVPLSLRLLSEEQGGPREPWLVWVYSGGTLLLWFSIQILDLGLGAFEVAMAGCVALTLVAVRYGLAALPLPAWLGGVRMVALGYLVLGAGLMASSRAGGTLWTLPGTRQTWLGTALCLLGALLVYFSLSGPDESDLQAGRRRLARVPAAAVLVAPLALLIGALWQPKFPVGAALHAAGLAGTGLLLLGRARDEGPSLWGETCRLGALGALGVAAVTATIGDAPEVSAWPLTLQAVLFTLPLLTGQLYRERQEVAPLGPSESALESDLNLRYVRWRSLVHPVLRFFRRQA